MAKSAPIDHLSLEHAIDHVLNSNEVSHEDRVWFLLASLSDMLLTKEEQTKITEILKRLEDKLVKIKD
ncbi:MAG: hypothetical protein QNJ38_21925 [Prochloraceae cyanobacterium]|nr:hypothetical protein [Prochloraceae cyanobacterium]